MSELAELTNISKIIESKLNQVNIFTKKELSEIRSKEAFMRIRIYDSTACINMLCALEGAIEGIRWHHLSDEIKKELKEFY